MNRFAIIIFIFIQSFCAFGQEQQPFDKYDLDKDCDQGGQQTMNVCMIEALVKLDKIMVGKYKCLLNSLDKIIKQTSVKDPELTKEYRNYRNIIVKSQATWAQLQKQNASLYEVYYNGGSIFPMMFAASKIQDVKDRLRRLDHYIEILEQDQPLLTCK